MNTTSKPKTIVISGGFDPIHPGHIAMFEAARKYGEVHIVLNSDVWLVRKKGFFFQPWADRRKILEVYTPHIRAVDDSDGTVCEALKRIKPDYFGNGGDCTDKNTPELDVCVELGIEPVFGLGGDKYSSNSAIIARQRVMTRWGYADTIFDTDGVRVKVLTIEAGKELSLQVHNDRSEFFFLPKSREVKVNLPGVWHAPRAPDDEALIILEVQVGVPDESDITRIPEGTPEYTKGVAEKVLLNK